MWAYSIPAKILHLVQDQIFKHLATICNLSFSMGIIPTILKIAKIIPIDQKDSKLEVSNYRPMSLLSNIDNILQILYYKHAPIDTLPHRFSDELLKTTPIKNIKSKKFELNFKNE